jgi:hypothetical protein
MTQTKLQSLFESFINIAIGYWISFAANWFILPLFGFNVSISQNFKIGFLYTLVSVARSYMVRRFFNKKHKDAKIKSSVKDMELLANSCVKHADEIANKIHKIKVLSGSIENKREASI